MAKVKRKDQCQNYPALNLIPNKVRIEKTEAEPEVIWGEERIIKGYRVKVSYEKTSYEEAKRIRDTIARIFFDPTMRRHVEKRKTGNI
jgi:hypothetical protein